MHLIGLFTPQCKVLVVVPDIFYTDSFKKIY
jgi:hypothetical protein